MKLQKYLYLPFISAVALTGFNGCGKSIVGPSVSSVSSTPGFDGKIDGADFFYQEGTEFESGAASDTSLSQSGGNNKAAFESWVCRLAAPYEGVQITKGQLAYSGDRPEEEKFKEFLTLAGNPYAQSLSKEGIIITYTDAAGTKWSSNLGTAGQQGSTFRIISTKEETYFNDLYLKAYMQFDCNVYNDKGEVKTISNAKFVGYFNR